MERSSAPEILDDPALPNSVREACYQDMARLHRWLGTTGVIIRALRRDPLPVRSVLDIGCGRGGLLRAIRGRLDIAVAGVDLLPPEREPAFPIIKADAVRDTLPKSDVAVALCMAHHLSEHDLVQLIRNVGLSCRRFLVVDLVRHPLPIFLFRMFVAPFIHRINASDGEQSIRRAFTPGELDAIVRKSLAGSSARFRHTVAPLYMRQTVDITYRI